MLRKIHGTNFFHIKFLGRYNIKCQNGPVLPPAQDFYFNGQALNTVLPACDIYNQNMTFTKMSRYYILVKCGSSSSSAHYSPLLDIGLFKFSPSK
jgi:hypothetical protein